MPVRVLVLGGSYGGLATALNLADLCDGLPPRFGFENPAPGHKTPVEVTIVDERDGYYHLIGTPLALADQRYAGDIWVRFDEIPALQHSRFNIRHGTVCGVDLDKKVAQYTPHQTGKTVELGYDYLVAATGLRRSWPTVPQALTRQKYLDEVQAHIESVSKAKHGVAVIGGGAVGIEMAAELKAICPHVKVILIHSRDKLLSSEPLPDDFKEKTLELLQEAGVETIMGKRVQKTTDSSLDAKMLELSDGSQISVSEVIHAVSGPKPTTSYLPSEVLNGEGEVKVGRDLTFAADGPFRAHHFAIGDLVPQPGVKRCGGAMQHGHHAAYNIHQHILSSRGIIVEPQHKRLIEHGPNIGLAVGKKALGYSEQTGTMAGEDTMTYLFGDDLGFKYCWDYLRLSEGARAAEVFEKLPQPDVGARAMAERGVAVVAEA